MFRKEIHSSSLYQWLTFPGAIFIFFSLFKVFGDFPIFLFGGVLLIIPFFLSSFYENHVDDFLEINNVKRKIRSYPGDEEIVEIELTQKGFLPILNARLEVTYDQVIESTQENKYLSNNTETVQIPLTLFSFEQKKFSIPVLSKQRGVGRIRMVKIFVQNIMGMGVIDLIYNPVFKQEIIVYPSLNEVTGIENINPRQNGDQSARHSIFEQPTIPYGTRDYTSGDSFNRIHWKATARQQELQTKIVEKVNQLSWCFLVNLETSYGASTSSKVEEHLKHVAYMCRYATENRIPYEIYVNQRGLKGIPYVQLPLGEGYKHYINALELLARINTQGLSAPYIKTLNYLDQINKSPYLIHVGALNDVHLEKFKHWENEGYIINTLEDDNGHVQKLPYDTKGGQLIDGSA